MQKNALKKIKLLALEVLSEKVEIINGNIIAESCVNAINTPQRECEYPLFLRIICWYGQNAAIITCADIDNKINFFILSSF